MYFVLTLRHRTQEDLYAPPSPVVESTPAEPPSISDTIEFNPDDALAAFDFVARTVKKSDVFLPIARFLSPQDLFRLENIGFISFTDLDWADARAQYFVGKVLEQRSLTAWKAPEDLHLPSPVARRDHVDRFRAEWEAYYGAESLVGEPFVENRIMWIDGRGEECAQPPFVIDQEVFQSFFDIYFKEPRRSRLRSADTLAARVAQIERVPHPPAPKKKRTRTTVESEEEDDDTPASGEPSDTSHSPSPPKKQRQDNDADVDDAPPIRYRPAQPLVRRSNLLLDHRVPHLPQANGLLSAIDLPSVSSAAPICSWITEFLVFRPCALLFVSLNLLFLFLGARLERGGWAEQTSFGACCDDDGGDRA